MKKILILVCAILLYVGAHGQENVIPEPEFVGEVYVFNRENTAKYKQLPKERAQKRSAASASVYLTGFGKATTKLVLQNCNSALQLSNKHKYAFIIKAESNNTDPVSLIQLIRFETYSKERKSELASVSTFGPIETNNKNYIPFSAKKYGESSYLIVADLEVGEYGFILSDRDDAHSVIATFGIWDETAEEIRKAAELEKQRTADAEQRVKQMKKDAKKQKRKADK